MNKTTTEYKFLWWGEGDNTFQEAKSRFFKRNSVCRTV